MRRLLIALFSCIAAAPAWAAPQAPRQPQPASPRKWGRFDLDAPLAQLAKGDLSACASQLVGQSGHADCDVGTEGDRITRVQLAWDEARPGTQELIALRLSFDPAVAPSMTNLEWQLTQSWGAPVLEQLRRERNHKLFTLQWEDADHRATLEAGAPVTQPSRAVSLTFERKPPVLGGELAGLKPRPFPGFHLRWVR